MRFLLLLLGVSFFFIFFLFSQKSLGEDSLFPSIFLQANLYILSALIFIYLSLSRQKKKHTIDEDSPINILSLQDIFISSVHVFFKDIVYYVSLILFYFGFYLIFGEIFGNLEISGVFLLFNILVVGLFFLENKISFFSDLLRVNTSIISLYYIFFHVLYIFGYPLDFSLFDIGNILCILLLFYLFLYNSSGKSHKNTFYFYAISFIFLELIAGVKYFFTGDIFWYSAVSFGFALILSLFPEILKTRAKIPLRMSRIFSLIFFSLTILLSFSSFYSEDIYSIVYTLIVALSAGFLFSFHKIFTNYIAAFFASVGVFFSWSQMYFFLMPENLQNTYIFVAYYILSLFFLFPYKLGIEKNIYDTYFFHILSLIVNLVCVFLFFLFIDFSILVIGMFLLLESVYFASSYYSLKK